MKNVVSLPTSRAYAGVEHDHKLDSNSPILSLKTQKRKPLLQSVTQPDARKYFANVHLKHEEKQKS